MKFSALLLTLLAVSQLDAAAIAMIVTPEFLVLAADSKVLDAEGVALAPACRIRKIGGSFYVLHNVTEHAPTSYDAAGIVAGLTSKSVAALGAEMKLQIEAPLKRALAASRTQSAAAFNKKIGSRIAAGVIFVGSEPLTAGQARGRDRQ